MLLKLNTVLLVGALALLVFVTARPRGARNQRFVPIGPPDEYTALDTITGNACRSAILMSQTNSALNNLPGCAQLAREFPEGLRR